MLRTFNMGIGLILVVAVEDAPAVLSGVQSGDPGAAIIGTIDAGGEGVTYR